MAESENIASQIGLATEVTKCYQYDQQTTSKRPERAGQSCDSGEGALHKG
jgi:hypothetical protein